MEHDDAAIPDQALRSALEFAVGVAARRAALRPPLPVPAPFRSWLRQRRLPNAALGKVRAALVADGAFRASVADEANPAMVDEIGRVWLAHDEDWRDRVAELLAGGDAAGGGALRREGQRRQAAEAGQQRLAADVAELTEANAQLRREGERARDEIERLGEEIARLRRDLAETNAANRAAAADHARVLHRLHASVAAAHAQADAARTERDALRSELDRAQAARDAALARAADDASTRRATPTPGPEMASLVPDAVPLAARRRREPMGLPGGLAEHSTAAAEYLMAAPSMVVLVDGYNAAKLGWPGLDLRGQREQVIHAAERVARRWGTSLTVVFDGADVLGGSTRHRRLISVAYSPAGQTADDDIRARVAHVPVDRPITVVTNDAAIVADVRRAGCRTLPSDVWLSIAHR